MHVTATWARIDAMGTTYGRNLLRLIGEVGLWNDKGQPNQSAFAERAGWPVSRINGHVTGRHKWMHPDKEQRVLDTLNELARERGSAKVYSHADLFVGVGTQKPKDAKSARLSSEKDESGAYNSVARIPVEVHNAVNPQHGNDESPGASLGPAASLGSDQTRAFEPPHDPVAFGHALMERGGTFVKYGQELEAFGAALIAGQVTVLGVERPRRRATESRPARRADGRTPRK